MKKVVVKEYDHPKGFGFIAGDKCKIRVKVKQSSTWQVDMQLFQ